MSFTRPAVIRSMNIALGLTAADGPLGEFMSQHPITGTYHDVQCTVNFAMFMLLGYIWRQDRVESEDRSEESLVRVRTLRALMEHRVRDAAFVDDELRAQICEAVEVDEDGELAIARNIGHVRYLEQGSESANVGVAIGLLATYIVLGQHVAGAIQRDMNAWPEPQRLRVLRDATRCLHEEAGECCKFGEPIVSCARLINDLLPEDACLFSALFRVPEDAGNENVCVQ